MGDATFLAAERRDIAAILSAQTEGGAILACHTYPTYRYAWLRDGAFRAVALDRAGQHAPAARFYEWVAARILDQEPAMRRAIEETDRRRSIQEEWNSAHGITPQGIRKAIRDITDRVRVVAEEQAPYYAGGGIGIPKDELVRLTKDLEAQMKAAARALEYEKAALIRDQITELRKQLALLQDDDLRKLGQRISGGPRGRR